MIKVGQTTTNQTIALPYELTNDGDTSIQLNELKGNTTQNGTPTPSSPQQVNVVKGKNIAEDIFIDTRTDRYLNVLLADVDFMSNTTYTFSFNGTNGNKIYPNENLFTTATQISIGTSKIVVTLTTKDTISKTNTTQYDTSQNMWKIFKNSIVQSSANVFNDFQIEQGSTATPYLPYNTIQVKVVGKNLEEQIEQGGINGSGENYSSTTMIRSKYFIPVRPNTTYALSINGQGEGFNVAQYDENKTFISFTYNWQRVTTANNTRYIRINKTASINDKIQVEEGNTATPYEAYKSNNYPLTLGDIELCKIGTYQDRIYKNNGKWYLYKAIGKATFNGGESWGDYATATIDNTYLFGTSLSLPNNSSNYITTHFTTNTAAFSTATIGSYIYNNQLRLRVPSTIATTISAFKTWLSTHNTIVYYVLATPTTTEITDETLLEQLDAIGELYRGTNNIMITDTIAPVENIIIEKSNAEFDLVPYIKREPKLDYIDRKGDTGYTADGHYFENIIARKRAVEFELIPMSQEDYANVISRFLNITSIPVFISDTYTNQNLKLNMFKKAIISNTQLTEYGRIRGTKISLEEI